MPQAGYHAGKLMGSLMILKIGLCQIGVRVEGDHLRLSMSFAFRFLIFMVEMQPIKKRGSLFHLSRSSLMLYSNGKN